MKKLLVLIFLSIGFCSYASSLRLVNDTPYALIAVVESADGTLLGQQVLQPGVQVSWSKDLSTLELTTPNVPQGSITPYRVIWKCTHGGSFSFCSNVSPGSVVRASSCPGAQYCAPKKKKEKKEKTECAPCAPCPPCDSAKKDKLDEEKHHEGQ
jgi:hypothetical protein